MEKRLIDIYANGPMVMPAVVISVGTWDDANLITLAYVGKVAAKPPVMAISIRPSRYSSSLIQKYGEFVINVPDSSPLQLRAVDFCGTRTGRKVDKWKELNLTKEKAKEVQAPLIKEFPWNFECRVIERKKIGSHVCYWGEVLAVHAAVDTLRGDGLDETKQSQLIYIAGNYYIMENTPCGKQGFSLRR
ncbi:MAG TPA: flavin reductase family protein [Dehalococcoidia bacterium]|nr:flavin reductase family protein [Dehalococcoidia bacterium]